MSGEKEKVEKFQRYEFKYIIDSKLSSIIKNEIQNFMIYDGFIHEELGDAYIVRSLYFDNYCLSNFYEKVDGIRFRTKFRLRCYATEYEKGSAIFLEQKGRFQNRVLKKRFRINYSDLPAFYSERLYSNLYDRHSNPVIQDFIFQAYRKKLKPMVLVDYTRSPYTSDYDSNFRITIDSGLRARQSNVLFPSNNSHFIQSLAGHVIMEVKFHRRIPAWFQRVIQAYNLDRVSVSKFVVGMKSTGVAVDLS